MVVLEKSTKVILQQKIEQFNPVEDISNPLKMIHVEVLSGIKQFSSLYYFVYDIFLIIHALMTNNNNRGYTRS